jgi:hypothetical protein
MKNYFLSLILLVTSFSFGQESKIDTVAVSILDHMGDVIGELESCSYDLSSSQDIMDPDHGLVKTFAESQVIMVGPDKTLVKINGDKGNRGFWYNGTEVTYYSFTENNFAKIDAPDNIISTIDTLYMKYNIEVPAADFFYPAFTDDILDSSDSVKYLGEKIVDGRPCFHLKTTSEDMDVQYWISNDAYNLPKKFLIIYKNEGNRQYEGTFNNWVLNPVIPESVFEFNPPPKASEINILAK